MSNINYRNTRYCPELDGIVKKKEDVKKEILEDYPQAVDMHRYVSKNDDKYKISFMKAYNFKCAYCGVSISIFPKEMFEIDHYIYEKSFPNKKDAGYIENLKLACKTCNHNKLAFEISNKNLKILDPDNSDINDVFIRGDDYYINISDKYSHDTEIVNFYNQLELHTEARRLDYLLMNMIGLQSQCFKKNKNSELMGQAVAILRTKRNLVK